MFPLCTISRRRFATVAAGAALLVGGPLTAADAWAQYSLISVAQGGGNANGASSDAAINAVDGRYVAFTSAATNLVPSDTNAAKDVFVRDRDTNATSRVSLTSAGAEAAGDSEAPAINQDGRFIVFSSYAALVDGDNNSCATPAGVPTCSDIYVRDRQTNTTTRVSVASGGVQANGHSSTPSISFDGRFIAFESDATNLVAGDTNGRTDVFVHDRQSNTTARVSVFSDGSQMPRGGHAPLLGQGGSFVYFSGETTPQEATDPSTCDQATSTCLAIYERDHQNGATVLLSNFLPAFYANPASFQVTKMTVRAADLMRFVVIEQSGFENNPATPPTKNARARSIIYDRPLRRATNPRFTGVWPGVPETIPAISTDGSTVAVDSFGTLRWLDRASGFGENIVGGTNDVALSSTGRYTAFASTGAVVPADTNGLADIYLFDRDSGDGDNLPDVWETTFGLNPATSADANADADLDGLTNLQEFLQGSHPNNNSAHTRYFAEGAANTFFSTRFALVNPGETEALVVVRYLDSSGQVFATPVALAPKSRRTITPSGSANPGLGNDFSTVVESNQLVVVDRTMTWGPGGPWGGHAETSLLGPSTTWYLAEGATHGAFDLFYLLQNPNDLEATVTINYLRLDPATPITKSYSLSPKSRKTIVVDDEAPELAAVDVGASITSTLPIVVERAMYSTRPGQPSFAAGHGGAGVTAPAPRWFLAEGATGQFFDLYVLIANPGTTTSDVTVTYLLGNGGESFSKNYTVGGQTRRTLSIKDEDPRLADTAVSMIVETTNNQPLVVERAMWWPKDQWYEAHLSAGATSTGTRWAVADGEVSGPGVSNPWDTYILIANTSATDGSATVTLVPDSDDVVSNDPVSRTIPLPANSRVNVPFTLVAPPLGPGGRYGAIVESNGVEIVVERAMYQSVNGVLWSIGTASLATKLP